MAKIIEKPETLYILGLKARGEDHYGLTTWSGDAPIYYGIYDTNPGCWDNSVNIKPIKIAETEAELKDLDGWVYIGFGLPSEPESAG
jgi:hypothetical protein